MDSIDEEFAELLTEDPLIPGFIKVSRELGRKEDEIQRDIKYLTDRGLKLYLDDDDCYCITLILDGQEVTGKLVRKTKDGI